MKTITIIDALYSLRPNAEWTIKDEALEWLDKTQPRPTDQEISNEILRLQAEQPLLIAKANRAQAYKTESDPLFFKAQRGEGTIEEWQAKVEEIKQRFPYPA